jgi:glycosyltransferase involved in cell wall biosynthesis
VRTQAEAVPRYTSWYVGTRRAAPGIELPPERTLVLRDRYRGLDGLIDPVVGYDATASDAELRRWPMRGGIFLKRRDAMKRECARFIAVSGVIRDLLLAQGWPEERVVVHYMGVDTTVFRPDPAARPLAEREPIVFFAGRLVEKKGLEYLICPLRSSKRWRAACPSWRRHTPDRPKRSGTARRGCWLPSATPQRLPST